MTVDELLPYLKQDGESLKAEDPCGGVPTPTSQAGRDTQTGWRSKTAGNTNSSRPDDTTGDSPGT